MIPTSSPLENLGVFALVFILGVLWCFSRHDRRDDRCKRSDASVANASA